MKLVDLAPWVQKQEIVAHVSIKRHVTSLAGTDDNLGRHLDLFGFDL